MLVITDYTSFAEVRTTVGLSKDELTDETLSLEIYANSLELAFGGVTLSENSPGPGSVVNAFKTVLAISPQENRTEVQQAFYNLTKLFAAYQVSLEVATSLSMRAPKTLSDSKVTIGRFSPQDTWKDVIDALTLKLADVKDRIEDLGEDDTTGTVSMFHVIKPSYDPVTGE